MTYQYPLTVLSEIVPDQIASLRSLLKQIDDQIEANPILPFAVFTTVHFSRMVIIEPLVEKEPTWLAFSTNYDGPLDAHLKELYTKAGNGFDRVFSHCAGYRANGQQQFEAYIQSHKMPFPNAYYIGHRGLTVETIRKQNEIREAIQKFLDSAPQQSYQPEEVKENIIRYLKEKHSVLMTSPPPSIKLKSIWSPILIALAVMLVIGIVFGWKILGLLLLGLIVIIVLAYLVLRMKEGSDAQIEIKDEASLTSKITKLTQREDFTVQNQLTHLVSIKPGLFRLCLLKLVLWGINLLALVLYNKGKLGNIPTIHFARWVIIDKGKRLLFFSNFDGSWESYLGDFVDKAAVGLTAVWSNTLLFPITKNLIQDGATDEERFKYWTRVHQISTQVWYTAYKTLSVVNVLNNNLIHQGLFKKMTSEECKTWLQKL